MTPMTFRSALCLWLAVAALAPAGARAAEKPRGPRVAVLDVRALGGADPKLVTALSPSIVAEAARYPVQVIAGSDLRALLGLEAQKQLAGCDDSGCLAQIGGAMGVEYLLVVDVGEIGGRWNLSLSLLDVPHARAAARSSKPARSAGELMDVVPAAVAEAMAPFAAPAARPEQPAKPQPPTSTTTTTPSTAPTSSTASKPVPPAATATAASSTGSVQRIAGWTLVGVGGAALVGGIVAGVLAKDEHDQAAANPPSDEAALADVKSSVDAKLWVADGLFIAAVVAAGAGLAVALTAPSAPAPAAAGPSSAAPPTVGVGPIPGGGAVFVSGGF